MWTALLKLFICVLFAKNGVREVSASSCEVVPVRLALGQTTQVVLEQEPKLTLFADKKHFKINTNELAPRSLAIIPFFEGAEIETLSGRQSGSWSPDQLVRALNGAYKTNLFVFFEGQNQLMFELEFAPKAKADYILKVKQIFKGDCAL